MATTKSTTDPLVVLESFIGLVGKEERVFREGELVRADDPAVKKWPQFFGPATIGRVEQATAAPGELR